MIPLALRYFPIPSASFSTLEPIDVSDAFTNIQLKKKKRRVWKPASEYNNAGEWLEQRTKKFKMRHAFRIVGERAGDNLQAYRFNYEQLLRQTDAFGNGLNILNYQTGDRILSWMPNRSESVISQLSCFRGGFNYVGIPPSFDAEALDQVFNITSHDKMKESLEFGKANPSIPDALNTSSRFSGVSLRDALPHTNFSDLDTNSLDKAVASIDETGKSKPGKSTSPIRSLFLFAQQYGPQNNHQVVHSMFPEAEYLNQKWQSLEGAAPPSFPKYSHIRQLVTLSPTLKGSEGFSCFKDFFVYDSIDRPVRSTVKDLSDDVLASTTVLRKKTKDSTTLSLIPLSQKSFLKRIAKASKSMDLTPDDIVCSMLPLCHFAGQILGPLATFDTGGLFVLPGAEFDPHSILTNLSNESWTLLQGTPTHFHALADAYDQGPMAPPATKAERMEIFANKDVPAPTPAYLKNIPYDLSTIRAAVVVGKFASKNEQDTIMNRLGVNKVYNVTIDKDDISIQ